MASCGENCKKKENKSCEPIEEVPDVPYRVHELTVASISRLTLRLFWAMVVSILLLFASYIGWLVYESQYETLDYSYEYDYQQDGQGTNIIGNGNEVIADGSTTPSEGES